MSVSDDNKGTRTSNGGRVITKDSTKKDEKEIKKMLKKAARKTSGIDFDRLNPENYTSDFERKLRRSKLINQIVFISAGVMAVLVIVIIVLLLTGICAITFKSPSDDIAVVKTVCTKDDIAKFNKMYYDQGNERNDGGNNGSYVEQFALLLNDIRSRDDYDRDYACLNMAAYAARYSDNAIDDQLGIADKLAELEKTGDAYIPAELTFRTTSTELKERAESMREWLKTLEESDAEEIPAEY